MSRRTLWEWCKVLLVILISKRAVRPAAESYEKQKQFITNANHELKTPLTLIRTNLDILESEQGPGMGGAMLAAVACGAYPSVQAVCDAMVRVVDTVEPDPAIAARYEERYQKFRKIYPALKPIFPEID